MKAKRKVKTHCKSCGDVVIVSVLKSDPPMQPDEIAKIESEYICLDCEEPTT